MNIESILQSVLGKSSANKNPKIATPSMDVLNRLMGSSDEPMSERTPIGGSSTTLPQSSLTKLMNGNDATSGNISSDPGALTPDSTPPPDTAIAAPPTSDLMTGADGALSGLSAGVKGATSKAPLTIDPVAISANPMAKELAGGGALRQLYDGGTVDPGETVSIGERGPEILHVDKDGKAIVIPDTSVHSAQEPARIEPHSGVVSAPPTDLQTTPQQVITPVTPIETTAPAPTNQDVQNQPMAVAPITPVDTTAPTVNNQQPQSQPLQMQVQAPADNEPPVNQLYQRPDGGTVNIATNNAPVQSEEDYLRGKMADVQSYRPTNKWAEAGFGALQGLQKGVQQAVYGTRDNSPIVTLDQLRQQREAAKYAPRLQQIMAQRAAEADRQYKLSQANRNNAVADYNIARPDLEANKQQGLMKRADARVIMQQYNHLPEFDPTDPDNADFVKAAQEAGVPVPPKSAKSSFKYITDAKTGKTYVDVSDATGNRKLQEVTKDDGSPLEITTPQQMTAADKKEQRDLQDRLAKEGNVTKIKVAQIGAKKAVDVANINSSDKGADRAQRQQQFVQSFQLKAANDLRQFGQDQQKRAQYIMDTSRKIQNDLGAGKIDQATANMMLGALQ